MSNLTASDFIFVYITFDKQAEAEDMGRQLLEQKLAACCNLIPGMQSIYHWQGKIETAQEFIMIAKTKRDRFESLKNFVTQNHSYECPCIMALPITDGNEPYLSWLQSSLE